MGKYDIKYACGHEDVVELFGKESERQRKLEWLATQDCPKCKKQQKIDLRKEQIINFDLPSLSGSEKQIEWAIELRGRVIDSMIDEYNKSSDEEAKKKVKTAFFKGLSKKTDSKYWIDRRDDSFLYIIRDLVQEGLQG